MYIYILFMCLSGALNGLLYICVLYYFLVYLYFILYFSDMFYIQWFCNPLDLLNENEIQYNTAFVLQEVSSVLKGYNIGRLQVVLLGYLTS
jgi:hypothetical protein